MTEARDYELHAPESPRWYALDPNSQPEAAAERGPSGHVELREKVGTSTEALIGAGRIETVPSTQS